MAALCGLGQRREAAVSSIGGAGIRCSDICVSRFCASFSRTTVVGADLAEMTAAPACRFVEELFALNAPGVAVVAGLSHPSQLGSGSCFVDGNLHLSNVNHSKSFVAVAMLLMYCESWC